MKRYIAKEDYEQQQVDSVQVSLHSTQDGEVKLCIETVELFEPKFIAVLTKEGTLRLTRPDPDFMESAGLQAGDDGHVKIERT